MPQCRTAKPAPTRFCKTGVALDTMPLMLDNPYESPKERGQPTETQYPAWIRIAAVPAVLFLGGPALAAVEDIGRWKTPVFFRFRYDDFFVAAGILAVAGVITSIALSRMRLPRA